MKFDQITNKREISDINPNDEFYTPKYAITPLSKYLKRRSKIWCPFDTADSLYVRYFEKMKHEVRYTHIGYGQDFFDLDFDCDYIISNPPYSLKFEVFERLFELGKPFAMLVGVVGLFESQKRFNLFKSNDFEVMYFDKRISYFRDYSEQKPSKNPPFSSVYITKDILPEKRVFEVIDKSKFLL